jgi:hypothetical protein
MARGGHGLTKVSPGHAMPYHFTLCRQATPEGYFRGGTPEGKVARGRLQLFSTPHTIQYESSITAPVGGSNFSALDNVKYVKICFVVY